MKKKLIGSDEEGEKTNRRPEKMKEEDEDDEENDEHNSLLSMVDSYASRKGQHEVRSSDSLSDSEEETGKKEKNGERESKVVQVEEEAEEEEEEEDKGEGEEMLLAMMRSRQDVKQSEDDKEHHDEDGEELLLAMMKPRYRMKQPEDDEENVDDDNVIVLPSNANKSRKQMPKTSLRNKKRQEASVNRHAALVEEVSLGNAVNMIVLQCDTLGIEENKSSFADQESHSTTVIHEIQKSKMEESINKCEQIKVLKEMKSSKGSKVLPQTDTYQISAKTKKNKVEFFLLFHIT